MIFVKATKESEAGLSHGPEMAQLFGDMGRYNQQLIDAGILKDGDGLKPTSHGKRIQFNGTSRTVVDGPFTKDVNELVSGYWIWEVKDMDEAVEWVKKCPNPMMGPSEIEIRPVYEMADFADMMTPEAEKIHTENIRKSSK